MKQLFLRIRRRVRAMRLEALYAERRVLDRSIGDLEAAQFADLPVPEFAKPGAPRVRLGDEAKP